jgi:hypothetical protein
VQDRPRNGTADFDFLIGSAPPVQGKHGNKLCLRTDRATVREQNGASFRRNYFEEKFEQGFQ